MFLPVCPMSTWSNGSACNSDFSSPGTPSSTWFSSSTFPLLLCVSIVTASYGTGLLLPWCPLSTGSQISTRDPFFSSSGATSSSWLSSLAFPHLLSVRKSATCHWARFFYEMRPSSTWSQTSAWHPLHFPSNTSSLPDTTSNAASGFLGVSISTTCDWTLFFSPVTPSCIGSLHVVV